MDKWFLKDGQICFKDENAELNNWDLKSVVSCLNTRDDKIAYLEDKLAESEDFTQGYRKECAKIQSENVQIKQQLKEKDQAIESLQEINQSLGQTCNNDAKEIERLNKLLAEKEKERHEEWLSAKEWKWECDRLKKELHIAKQETLHFQNKYFAENQKAIEELEKVIEFAKTQDEFGFRKSGMEIFMFVDQQIKELKGEK